MIQKLMFSVVVILVAGLCSLEGATVKQGASDPQLLKTGWLIRSSADVPAGGEEISKQGFDCRGWYPATVPTTVLSALAANGLYRDLYFGRNMESVSPEPFRTSWWYRREFDLPAAARSENVRIILDGVNYSANIFVNGAKVAGTDAIFGAFRRFDLDITRLARKKGNVLAVEVFPPRPGDFTIGFVDWNPAPPDQNMGLWREVRVEATGAVTIEHPFVQSKVDLQSLQEARLAVTGTLMNHAGQPVSGTINGEIDGGIHFSQKYSLAAGESREIRF
ncbi:MAG TPA: hypothetical protein VLR94_05515, partial [Acidobacteriota bacterium]|nr:hypothetical protein [Acidobacteriota bacterium]